MSEPPDRDSDDPGEPLPIPQLRDFELPPDPLLLDRVRRSIDRREAASGFVYLTTHGCFTLFLELLSAFPAIFHASRPTKSGEKES